MYKISNLTINLDDDSTIEEIINKKYNVKLENIKIIRILKKSIDSRDHQNILFVYTLLVELNNFKISKRHKNIIYVDSDDEFTLLPFEDLKTNKKVAIIGNGPSGIFAAINLARSGFDVSIFERGKEVDKRIKDIEVLFKDGKLDPNSNICYGEGGAGTFSDGKLNTGVNDYYSRVVYNEFFKYGASEKILYEKHRHIGSDVLIKVLKNIRLDLEKLNVKYYFEHTLVDLDSHNEKVSIILEHQGEKISKEFDYVILAIGHSPIDTFEMLHQKGMKMEAKPFSMGVRIEHLQEDVNKMIYGKENYNHPKLPPATYKLAVHLKNGRSVYTFCMCPGGYVVNSSSEEGHLLTNGMSYFARDGKNANAALLCNVTPQDFDNDPLKGLYFQRIYERKAYLLTNSFKAPVQLVGDFVKGRESKSLKKVVPTYPGYELRDLKDCLPDFVYESLKLALPKLDISLRGYFDKEAVLTGIESRSSAPLRLVRENYMSSLKNVFVCGEGSGYSGGITTSAIDGIKCSNAIKELVK